MRRKSYIQNMKSQLNRQLSGQQHKLLKTSNEIGYTLQEDMPFLADMYRAGLTYKKIAEHLNISERYGVPDDIAITAVGGAIIGTPEYEGLISQEEIEQMERFTGRENTTDPYWNYNLINARMNAGVTYDELSKRTGISLASLYSYERARSFPSEKNAKKIACELQVEREYVFPIEFREVIKGANAERKKGNSERDSQLKSLDDLTKNNHPSVNLEIEATMQRQEMYEILEKALNALPKKEERILRMHYGLTEDGNAYNFEQIGKIEKITGSRASQIANSGLRNLLKKDETSITLVAEYLGIPKSDVEKEMEKRALAQWIVEADADYSEVHRWGLDELENRERERRVNEAKHLLSRGWTSHI